MKEFLYLCYILPGPVLMYNQIKFIKKYSKRFYYARKLLSILDKDKNNNSSNGYVYYNLNGYILTNGYAKQVESKTPFIISLTNNIYSECFLLTKFLQKPILVQPNRETIYSRLRRRYINPENMNFLKRLFFFRSKVVKNKDKIFMFGKEIGRDNTSFDKHYKKYQQVKPFYISLDSFEDLKEKTSMYPLLRSSLILFFEGFLFYIVGYKLKEKIKNKLSHTKRRKKIICSHCNSRLSNIICEKCNNISDYCKECYLKLKTEIDQRRKKISEVRCPFCGGVLNVVNVLICE